MGDNHRPPTTKEKMHMKKIRFTARLRLLLCVLLASFAAGVGYAQVGGNFALTWSTVDGGGGLSSGGQFNVKGTIGQPDAGQVMSGTFTLNGGFWNTTSAV